MASNKIRLPASAGGIMQYYDEYKSKIQIDPKVMVGIAIAVVFIVVLLHFIDPFHFLRPQ